MISSILQGGLGNQLFQISAAVSLASDNNDEAIFSIKNHLLPKQGRKCINYLNNIFQNISFNDHLDIRSYYYEPDFSYQEIIYHPYMCLYGYFQSEKYFFKNSNKIRDLFSIDGKSYDIINGKYSFILDKNPISMHVRRGDYLKFKDTHPPCSVEYYNQAISSFSESSIFLVISDDIEWCKENFLGDKFYFVEGNEDYIDLYLMSLCKNNIIANSSFSWWAAWLNRNKEKIVIAPEKWFGNEVQYNTDNLLPSSWETI